MRGIICPEPPWETSAVQTVINISQLLTNPPEQGLVSTLSLPHQVGINIGMARDLFLARLLIFISILRPRIMVKSCVISAIRNRHFRKSQIFFSFSFTSNNVRSIQLLWSSLAPVNTWRLSYNSFYNKFLLELCKYWETCSIKWTEGYKVQLIIVKMKILIKTSLFTAGRGLESCSSKLYYFWRESSCPSSHMSSAPADLR